MSETTPGFKPKKSVALSGVPAGNTALCSVGKSGNDLHYRGYDILDIAGKCDFEEIAYLLIHGKLPNRCRAQGLQGQTQEPAWPARDRARCPGAAAGFEPSHGRDAYRRLGLGLQPAGEGRPQCRWRARHR